MENNSTITTPGSKLNVLVTRDKSLYYSTLSKNWAISNSIIDNQDYSSKYYANESKQQADAAKNQADIALNKTTEVVNIADKALAEIITAKQNAINFINTTNISVLKGICFAKDFAVNACAEQAALAKEYAQMANGWDFSYDEENEMLVFVENV